MLCLPVSGWTTTGLGIPAAPKATRPPNWWPPTSRPTLTLSLGLPAAKTTSPAFSSKWMMVVPLSLPCVCALCVCCCSHCWPLWWPTRPSYMRALLGSIQDSCQASLRLCMITRCLPPFNPCTARWVMLRAYIMLGGGVRGELPSSTAAALFFFFCGKILEDKKPEEHK